MLTNNLLALFITLVAALTWLRLNDFAAHRGWIDSKLSRKIIHIGTGPIFVICWLLFNPTANARYLAAIIPLMITFQFLLVGMGIMKDEAAVQAMSRTGDRKEILKGPLFYGIAFVVLTSIYWYDSPIGIIALMILCGGDGLADIIGRKNWTSKIPWSAKKTWGGSIAMFLGGWALSLIVIAIFISAHIFSAPLSNYLIPITTIALTAAIIESLPINDVDNITITITAMLLGHLFF